MYVVACVYDPFFLYFSLTKNLTNFSLHSTPFVISTGYAWYDYQTDLDNEDQETVGMCVGFGGLLMACAFTVELILGFVNCDDNKMWGFTFIALAVCSSILTFVGAGYAVDNVDCGGCDKEDNAKYYTFVLTVAPVMYRGLIVFMKARDVALGTDTAKA